MNNDSVEIAYNTKEITDMLKIGSSTLRKWCLALEEQGYSFTKVEQNKRLFLDKDLILLKHFQKLVQENKLQLEQASKVVIARFSAVEDEEVFSEGTTSVPAENEMFPTRTTSVPAIQDDEEKEQMKQAISMILEKLEQQEEFNKELMNRLDHQEQYIKESIDKRDRTLLEHIRADQEQKKLMIEQQQKALEEIATAKKKSWFTKLFGK